MTSVPTAQVHDPSDVCCATVVHGGNVCAARNIAYGVIARCIIAFCIASFSTGYTRIILNVFIFCAKGDITRAVYI